jgi:hypothetical protein
MWAVFGRCRDPRVGELMAEAEPLLHASTEPQLGRALSIYTEVVRLAPSFSEVGGGRRLPACGALRVGRGGGDQRSARG